MKCKHCKEKATRVVKMGRDGYWIVAYPKFLPLYCFSCAVEEKLKRNLKLK